MYVMTSVPALHAATMPTQLMRIGDGAPSLISRAPNAAGPKDWGPPAIRASSSGAYKGYRFGSRFTIGFAEKWLYASYS